jgi:hypothetical protein
VLCHYKRKEESLNGTGIPLGDLFLLSKWTYHCFLEVLTLLLVIFAALSYIDNHNNRRK